MKARVKATGEIVELADSCYLNDKDYQHSYYADELEGIESELDYWTRLEHTYAGMAMQALIVEYRNAQSGYGFSESIIQETCAKECIQFAHALVEKMKSVDL